MSTWHAWLLKEVTHRLVPHAWFVMLVCCILFTTIDLYSNKSDVVLGDFKIPVPKLLNMKTCWRKFEEKQSELSFWNGFSSVSSATVVAGNFAAIWLRKVPEYLEQKNVKKYWQDSWAIAKKTARCAQYMGALKILESPHYAPGYLSRNL